MSDALYRGMSAADLDRQYNFRALVPEHPQFFERWTAASADARKRLRCEIDVPYGAHPRERIDLFPAGEGAPLVVFIHGGYWRALSKNEFSFLAEPFVARGIAFAAMGYGLCPEVGMDTLVGHVRDGVSWLAKLGADHGVSTRRLVLTGHSAGGHLAVTMASLDWTTQGLPRDLIKGAVGISGIYDLEPIRFTEVNDALRLDAEAARRVSPIHHVPAPPSPPLVLALGAEETAEVHRQQADCAAAWRAAGNGVEELSEPGAHHFSVVDRLADPESALHRAVVRLPG